MDQSSDLNHKRLCLRWLRKLSRSQGRLPLSFYLDNLQKDPVQIGGGGFSDVFVGTLGTQKVCLKVLRIFQTEGHKKRVIQKFCHETLVWRQVQHPNVLPFLGVTETLFPGKFTLVSPFMKNGNVMSFLEVNPSHDRFPFVLDIANGLEYLHSFSPPIVHGDVRGANILVQDDLTCCLADFGLARISDTQPLTGSSTSAPQGSARWCAPEVFAPESFPDAPKEKRDVFAFACTVVEIYSGKAPFAQIPTEYQVLVEIPKGKRPLRPVCLPSELWMLVERCWPHRPSERISMSEVSTNLSCDDVRLSGVQHFQLQHQQLSGNKRSLFGSVIHRLSFTGNHKIFSLFF
ncbi:kinase-like domain-containing protein [Flagelloscypha sp. PMI_526]|nr:kinase-like domain-containing protein [Flagelloscypha sp. PMI_526]